LAPADPTPVEVDVDKALSAQDLRSIKKRDPFLYYSIPGLREAAVRQKRVDMYELAQDGLRRDCASCSYNETIAKVKRHTRISFECPADVLMEDLVGDHTGESFNESRLDGFLSELFGLNE
jgi:hypothetical protein